MFKPLPEALTRPAVKATVKHKDIFAEEDQDMFTEKKYVVSEMSTGNIQYMYMYRYVYFLVLAIIIGVLIVG